MKTCLFTWLLCSLLISSEAETLRRLSSTTSYDILECLYLRGKLITSSGDRQTEIEDHRCQTSSIGEEDGLDGMVYDLPESVLAQLNTDVLSSGISVLVLEGARIHRVQDDHNDPDYIEVDQNVKVTVVESETERRLTLKKMGVSTVLMVRVETSDSSVSLDSASLSERIFDLNRVSFSSQYEKCSNGRMQFVPATGNNIVGGVGSLTLQRSIRGENMTNTIENELLEEFFPVFGSTDDYDHIMFCIPPGTINDWIGYTYGRTYRSYFNNYWCGWYSLLFHEIGHNLGLQHSNEIEVSFDGSTKNEYEDRSCMMGRSYPSNGAPAMCFNGVKFRQLEWFPEHTIEVRPEDGPWVGSIAAFVDVARLEPGTTPILIQVGDTYLVFNRAKDYNKGVMEKRDYVTVTQGEAIMCDQCVSQMLGGVHEIFNLEITLDAIGLSTGLASVTFEACGRSIIGDLVDVQQLSIRLAGEPSGCVAAQSLSTVAPVVAPTSPATVPPTSPPSPLPTSPPSPLPTSLPTIKPTSSPTLAPTSSPTTPSPTSSPTPNPTPLPTLLPTSSPTLSPTPRPTALPTSSPTLNPTPPPTSMPTNTLPPTRPPSPGPTFPPTFSPTPSPTPQPTLEPTNTPPPTEPPSPRPTSPPTEPPSPVPTSPPTLEPTNTPPPTELPTPGPTSPPTEPPSPVPTYPPTLEPTNTPPPTELPTPGPTSPPTSPPTLEPTDIPPTPLPTFSPTLPPTVSPTPPPTEATRLPTDSPTFPPTPPPTGATRLPTNPPTEPITDSPTGLPTDPPTELPTDSPTDPPTDPPTVGNRPTPPRRGVTRPPTPSPTGATRPPTSPPVGKIIPSTPPPTGATRPPTSPPIGKIVPTTPPPTGATRPPTQPPTGATRPPTQPPAGKALPTDRPTASPTTQTPSLSIAPSHNPYWCDDKDFDKFFIPSLNQTQRCVWLEGRSAYLDEVCGTELGRETCPETCGVCTDDCDDTDSKFYIGTLIRDCLWMRLRPQLKKDLCFGSSDVSMYCPEYCDVCDGLPPSEDSEALPPPPVQRESPPKAEGVCDDDKYKSFFVKSMGQFQHCVWLAARPEYKATLCDPTDESNAYDICEETCGKCVDTCNDTSGLFQVGTAVRDCLWLSLRIEVQELLCTKDHNAYNVCPETCDACDLPPDITLAPTPTPVDLPEVFCDDSKFETFYVPDLNEFQRCVWLAARPDYIAQLCPLESGSNARELCPETCSVCFDDCEDSTNKFTIDTEERNCLWIALRPELQESICSDPVIATTCPESCDTCDGPAEPTDS